MQLLTPCTVGNGWLRIMNFGIYAVSLFDKRTAALRFSDSPRSSPASVHQPRCDDFVAPSRLLSPCFYPPLPFRSAMWSGHISNRLNNQPY